MGRGAEMERDYHTALCYIQTELFPSVYLLLSCLCVVFVPVCHVCASVSCLSQCVVFVPVCRVCACVSCLCLCVVFVPVCRVCACMSVHSRATSLCCLLQVDLN